MNSLSFLKQMKFNAIDNIICIITLFLILWEPLQVFILKFDGAGRIPNMLSIVGLFLISGNIRKILSIKAVKIYLLLSVYMFVNAVFKGSVVNFYNSYFILFFAIFRQQIFMWLIIYLARKNLSATFFLLTIGYSLFTLLCFIFASNLSSGRLGGEIDSNDIGIQSCFAVGYIILYQIIKHRKINLFNFILWLCIPVLVILRTGSRTAFIILCLLLLGYFLFSTDKSNYKQNIMIVFVILVSAAGISYILGNTLLGERLLESHTQMEGYTDTIFDKFGDRGPQYYFAWPIIAANFITGIGLSNYIHVGETGLVLHSEILVQLCENGIIGLLLFLLIYYIISRDLLLSMHRLKNFNKMFQLNKFIMLFLFASFLICFVMWSYSFTFCFSLYAIAVVFFEKSKILSSNH